MQTPSFRIKRGPRGLVTEVTGVEIAADKPEKKQAQPMLWRDRVGNYRHQNGCKELTPAQRRRAEHKKRHRAAKSKRRRRVGS